MKAFLFLLLLVSNSAVAEKILFIGDSHSVGEFGKKLDALLRTRPNAEVSTYASCGSSVSWWYSGHATTCGAFQSKADGTVFTANTYSTPKISELLERHHPDLVVIALGTNYGLSMATTTGKNTATEEIKKLATEIEHAGARCIWISHPKTRRFADVEQSLFSLIEKALGNKCTLINSLLLTTYPNECKDGIHYNCKSALPAARKWAADTFGKF